MKEKKEILMTEHLVLREYAESDFCELREIISDRETMKYYQKPYDEKGVRQWIEWNLDNYRDLGFGLWAIELKESREFIGDCGITMQIINHKIVPEIGYHINKKYHNHGYATEAARACRDLIFSTTPFRTVYSYMNKENIASRTVAEKSGMKQVDEYNDGEETLSVYAITREEWEMLG
ncbi:MAG: GNAT family N-acetyltransferase [Clostridia bacterium]|nr:GNAT family N-acetyltransferase [Clostridia bacterium]